MPAIKLGISPWNQAASWTELLDVGRRVDRLGYDSLWNWDHTYAIFGDPYQPIFDGWMVLAGWALATERVQLGLMVAANTLRNPGITAKMTVTLDHMSNGRAALGIGGAWADIEHTALGIDFGRGMGERLDWLDEAVAACKALFEGQIVTSEPGAHYAFRELRSVPMPIQPHLPILIGGTGRKKTLRTLAKYGDIWNAFGTPDEVRELDSVLRDHCAAVGRDEREIERQINLWLVIRDSEAEARKAWAEATERNRATLEQTIEESRPLFGPPEAIADVLRQYVAAGFPSMLVEMPAPYDVETLERLIGEVKPLVEAE